MELFKLFGTVLIDDKEAIDSLNKVDKKGETTSKKLGNLADKGLKIGTAVLAGTGVAITGLMALANTTGETADKWDKLSLRTGIAVEELQRWGYAAGQSGADIEVLEVGMKKLSDTMVDAQNGSTAAQGAYEQLGISMEELATMTPEQAFESVMNALADMEDGALKNSIGNDLLGKSFVELKPLIAEGADGMQALKDRADELGVVMSEEAVDAGVVYGDTMADATASIKSLKDGIMVDLLPKLTEMLNWFIAHMPAIKETASNALDFVAGSVGFVIDNANILIPILSAVLAGFMALKIISIISGLMAAYTAFTTTATGVQIGLNAALMANPIGLVIAAIVALIAIGVALYMNWDKIKEVALSVFGAISDFIGAVCSAIGGFFVSLWETIKTIFAPVGKFFTGIWDTIKSTFTKIGSVIGDAIGGAFKKVVNSIIGFAEKTINGFIKAINLAIGLINAIPGVEIGKLSLLEIPKLENGGILKKGQTGYLEGNGDEAVVPLEKTGWIDKIASRLSYGLGAIGGAGSNLVSQSSNQDLSILSEIKNLFAQLLVSEKEEMMIENIIYFGDDKVYQSAQRGKLKSDRRYKTQTSY